MELINGHSASTDANTQVDTLLNLVAALARTWMHKWIHCFTMKCRNVYYIQKSKYYIIAICTYLIHWELLEVETYESNFSPNENILRVIS